MTVDTGSRNVEPVTVGVVGAGSVVRARHLPGLRQIPGVDVVAVANRHTERARAVAEEFGIGTVYDHWHDVVDDPTVDAVFVGTPPNLHETVSLRALEQGKHVFCQARMTNDLESASRMLAADRRTSLTTMVCPAPHYMAVDPHVRNVLASGDAIGEVRHVVVQHPGPMFADPGKPLHWRQREDLNGINVLDVGIVGEVLERWFGPVTEVGAIDRTWVHERPPDPDGHTTVQIPDAVSAIGRFASGALLTALFTWGVRGGGRSLTVHGDRGSLTCRPQSETIEFSNDDTTSSHDVPAHEQETWHVERDFVDAVRNGRKGDPSFVDGARNVAFTHAIVEAAASGRTVAVPEV